MAATLTHYLQSVLVKNLVTPNSVAVKFTHISIGTGGVDGNGRIRVPEPNRTAIFSEDSASGKLPIQAVEENEDLRQVHITHALDRSVANGTEISELGLWYFDGTTYHLLVHRTFTRKVKDDISRFTFFIPIGFDTFNPESQGLDTVSEFIRFFSALGRYIKAGEDVESTTFSWDVAGVQGFTANSVRVFSSAIR